MTPWQEKHLKLVAHHPKIQELADYAQDFAKWYAKDERLFRKTVFVICGETGSGKTHLSKALYSWARSYSGRIGASADWHSWPEACKLITEGYDGCIADMMDANLLCIDDIGAETDSYKTGKPVDNLCQVLSRRENKFTVVTTNIASDRWNQRFDIRIADRLIRNSTVIDMTSVPSYSVARILQTA